MRSNKNIPLSLKQNQTQQSYTDEINFITMVTEYKSKNPSFLDPLKEFILWNTLSKYKTSRYYSTNIDKLIFVQNVAQNTNGFVTPDSRMVAYRNSIISNQILRASFYKVETKIAFQEIGKPKQTKKEVPYLKKVNV